MPESFCRVGDVDLCYETFGDPADPALLLVMGLATQMLAWHEDFCRELTRHGLFVIRYDNRDVGRSSRIDARPPTVAQILRRERSAMAYTLEDMADDGIGLLDALGIEHAHVAGASMGGMIAQAMAIRHPDRVLSLASIMSTTGARRVGRPALKMYPWLLRRSRRSREGYAEHVVALQRVIGSPAHPRDDDEIRRLALLAYDRGVDPHGPGRQLGAIVTAADRTTDLGRVTVPTVVIHGAADRLVAPSGGRATADAIRGAQLVLIDGMGHDLPRAVWPQVVEAIVRNASRATRGRPAATAA